MDTDKLEQLRKAVMAGIQQIDRGEYSNTSILDIMNEEDNTDEWPDDIAIKLGIKD